jgi:hypothetical protein
MELVSRQPGGERRASVVLESLVTVPTDHVEVLLEALHHAGIDARDTGARVTTEDGLDAQAELLLRVPVMPPAGP